MDIIEEIKKQLKARYSGSTYNHAEHCYKQGITEQEFVEYNGIATIQLSRTMERGCVSIRRALRRLEKNGEVVSHTNSINTKWFPVGFLKELVQEGYL